MLLHPPLLAVQVKAQIPHAGALRRGPYSTLTVRIASYLQPI
jgi:hypothetical protein